MTESKAVKTHEINEFGMPNFRNMLRSSALEMTGHTANALEAFEQWREERTALVDFYETAMQQQKLLNDLLKNWKTLRKLYVECSFIQPSNKKIDEAVARLDKWSAEVEEASQQAQQVQRANKEQLDFLGLIKPREQSRKTKE